MEEAVISDNEDVIKINLDDKNNPYLLDYGYVSDSEIVLFVQTIKVLL